MKQSSSSPYIQLVEKGLAQVMEEHAFLIRAFVDVLRSKGEEKAALLIQSDFKEIDSLNDACVQAISFSFQLLNLAEEHVANSIRRTREAQLGISAERGHWGDYLNRLKEAGFEPQIVRKKLGTIEVEPVFTKHPTEAKRWSVLDLHREIVRLLKKREEIRTNHEGEHLTSRIRAVLERLWLTGEIYLDKPKVEDELNNLLYYLSEILPTVFHRLDNNLRYAWQVIWPDEAPLEYPELPYIQFGSWVGGDRDGHPFVTAEVTEEILGKMRYSAIDILKARLKNLSQQLSLNSKYCDCPAELSAQLKIWGNIEPGLEPWRDFVDLLIDKLDELSAAEFKNHLESLGRWLKSVNAHYTAGFYLDPLLRLFDCIGFHLARIDIRQNSDFYEKALSQIMEAAGIEEAESYQEWPEDRKLTFLNRELTTPRPLTHPSTKLPPEATEARATLATVVRYIERFGTGGLGNLIVSMTRNVCDLLTVYVLGKEVGLTIENADRLRCLLPVTPLFETYEDLERAPAITDAFLAHPCTQSSLGESRSDPTPRFTIMLGYSDSNKDTGILASQWVLHNTQRKLLDIGNKHQIKIIFFHGRGGTIGRGAGPTHRFLEALPKHSLEGGLRMTEQGEVIAQKFNVTSTAAANLEWLMAGTLGAQLLATQLPENPAICQAMELLVDSSRITYQALLNSAGFLSFYRETTPIDVIERSRIGSRPARRTGQATLKDLRAIPWVFSWNQARYYLPGWYGVGTAFEMLEQESPDAYKSIIHNVQTTPFLRYLLYNIESSLATSDEEWMRRYAELVEEHTIREKFLKQILGERTLSLKHIQHIFSGPLEGRRPRFWKTLQERQRPLRALHHRQIELLRQIRKANHQDKDLMDELLLVVNAIASGLRTTG